MDKIKLIKFLSLTESSNDAESLSAIRKANKFLKDNDTTWTEIIKISDALEAVIKRQREEYATSDMIARKERAYSYKLENDIKTFKFIIKCIIILIVFLLIGIIIK